MLHEQSYQKKKNMFKRTIDSIAFHNDGAIRREEKVIFNSGMY